MNPDGGVQSILKPYNIRLLQNQTAGYGENGRRLIRCVDDQGENKRFDGGYEVGCTGIGDAD